VSSNNFGVWWPVAAYQRFHSAAAKLPGDIHCDPVPSLEIGDATPITKILKSLGQLANQTSYSPP
jgi:hypothetical protein